MDDEKKSSVDELADDADDAYDYVQMVMDENVLLVALLARLAVGGANWKVGTHGTHGGIVIDTPEGALVWEQMPGDSNALFNNARYNRTFGGPVVIQTPANRAATIKRVVFAMDKMMDQIEKMRDAVPAPTRR